jgi:hypothetical protein
VGARSPDSPDGAASRRGKKAPPRSLSCKVRVGRVLRRGTATLTDEELRFHTGRTGREGEDFFLHLRLDELGEVEVDGPRGTLAVETSEHGKAIFQLGRAAEPWAAIIAARPDLARDLDIGKRARVAMVAVDDEALGAALAGRLLDDDAGALDVLLAGAAHPADLARLGALAARLRAGGVLWLIHDEDARGLGEEHIAAAARAAGLVAGKAIVLGRGRVARRLGRA